jgi:hypothetical protein
MDLRRTDDLTSLRARIPILLAVASGLLVAAPAGAEEPVVPPGNSAVNQYTEAFPTAHGDKDAHERDRGNRSPKKVIGKRNTEKLRQQGPEGEAVAQLTAETAPTTTADRQRPVESDESGEATQTGAAAPTQSGGGEGGGPTGAGGGGNGAETQAGGGGGSSPTQIVVAEPDGSSGLSEVISRATGSSSGGGMGIFLPLLILAALCWGAAYLARSRRPAA